MKVITFLIACFSILLTSLFVQGQQETTIFLSGQLVREDDRPVPRELRVELRCSGRVLRQVRPSSDGSFSFELGNRSPGQATSDSRLSPSAGGLNRSANRSVGDEGGFRTTLTGRADLSECKISLAPTAGWTSTEINLGIRNHLDKPDVGEIYIRPSEAGPATAVIEAEILAAPPEARTAFEKAQSELEKKDPDFDRASAELRKAVELYPSFGPAWSLLGEVQMALENRNEAREAFEKALEVDSGRFTSHLQLARLEIEDGHWKEAASHTESALEQQPDHPEALFYDGLARYYLGDLGRAQTSLEQLETQGDASQYPASLLHLGLIYARMEKIDMAAERLQQYLDVTPSEQIPAERRQKIEQQLQIWKGL